MILEESALNIRSGAELLRFDLGSEVINGQSYVVLTGWEGTERRCFWCGGELKGKLKRYCYGHMAIYYQHFEWGAARNWCCKRQEGFCANCGAHWGVSLEVHHIVPLMGGVRYFTAYNLPLNLMGLCHICHHEVHDAMRPPRVNHNHNCMLDPWLEAEARGQTLMALPLVR